MIKGVDHFGDCFVRFRPFNRLFSCKYRTFGQMSGLSTYFPFSLAFYFAIILTIRRSFCTLQLYHLEDGPRVMLPTWRRSDNCDVSSRTEKSAVLVSAPRKTFVCTSTTLTASTGHFPVWKKSCLHREETLYSRWLSLSTTQP